MKEDPETADQQEVHGSPLHDVKDGDGNERNCNGDEGSCSIDDKGSASDGDFDVSHGHSNAICSHQETKEFGFQKGVLEPKDVSISCEGELDFEAQVEEDCASQRQLSEACQREDHDGKNSVCGKRNKVELTNNDKTTQNIVDDSKLQTLRNIDEDGEVSDHDDNLEEGELKDTTSTSEEPEREVKDRATTSGEPEREVKDIATTSEVPTRRVCKFFDCDRCTWGTSCRFLHLRSGEQGSYSIFSTKRAPQPPLRRDYPPPRKMSRVEDTAGDRRHNFTSQLPKSPQLKPGELSSEPDWDRELRRTKELIEGNLRKKKSQDPRLSEYDSTSEESDKGFLDQRRYRRPSGAYYERDDSDQRVPHYESLKTARRRDDPKYEKDHRNARLSTRRHDDGDIRFRDRGKRRVVRLSGTKDGISRGDEWMNPRHISKSPRRGRLRRRPDNSPYSGRSLRRSVERKFGNNGNIAFQPSPYKRSHSRSRRSSYSRSRRRQRSCAVTNARSLVRKGKINEYRREQFRHHRLSGKKASGALNDEQNRSKTSEMQGAIPRSRASVSRSSVSSYSDEKSPGKPSHKLTRKKTVSRGQDISPVRPRRLRSRSRSSSGSSNHSASQSRSSVSRSVSSSASPRRRSSTRSGSSDCSEKSHTSCHSEREHETEAKPSSRKACPELPLSENVKAPSTSKRDLTDSPHDLRKEVGPVESGNSNNEDLRGASNPCSSDTKRPLSSYIDSSICPGSYEEIATRKEVLLKQIKDIDEALARKKRRA